MLKKEEEPIIPDTGEGQKPSQEMERTYLTVHCHYCGEQHIYTEGREVYCANEKCPNGKKPVDVDRYNLRRFIF